MALTSVVFLAVLILCLTEAAPSSPYLPPKLCDDIASHQDVVDQIVDYSLNGPGKNQSYDRLAAFTDAFGSRLAGSGYYLYKPAYTLTFVVLSYGFLLFSPAC